jgi:xylulokinase
VTEQRASDRTVAVGGGTRGGLWPRIVSSVTGRSQEIPARTIGAAYGDALLAAIGTGLAGRDADWNPIVDVVEADGDERAAYDALYRLYRDLYPATLDAAHALAALQSGPEQTA